MTVSVSYHSTRHSLLPYVADKGKRKAVPDMINLTLRREDVWGTRCIHPHIRTPALDGSEFGRFISWESASGTFWIGGWVGRRAGWKMWKRSNQLPLT
jgi:hypothetical protein